MSNQIRVRPNGPLKCLGDIRVEDNNGQVLAEGNDIALCRCGESLNKPFCDGAHNACGFQDAAHFRDERQEPLATAGPLIIVCRPNAMLLASGPMEIFDADEQVATTRNKAAFCRCGASHNKPFCDGSHKACDFSSD